jgi:hypothetical protein
MKIKKSKKNDILMQNKVFLYLAICTASILLIPFVGMHVSNKFNWSFSDFVIMGILLFGAGSLFVLTARRFNKHRLIIGSIFVLAFIAVWAELAVGFFTNLGN